MPRAKDALINLARAMLRRLNIEVMRCDSLEKLTNRIQENSDAKMAIEFLAAMPAQHVAELIGLLPESRGQLRQDLLALAACGMKRGGFFVEFGATDGIELSNTYLLENVFGWNGILAEPARKWHNSLRSNRRSPIDTRCVWSKSGETLSFRETEDGVLSTIDEYATADHHAKSRASASVYDVKTISLNDLLMDHNAPDLIDFLSIDTEGSELEILRHFDFSRYRFSIITCEHNHTSARAEIYSLLKKNGYRRVLENISAWDDWYLDESTCESFKIE